MIKKGFVVAVLFLLSACNYEITSADKPSFKAIKIHAGGDKVFTSSQGLITLKGTLLSSLNSLGDLEFQWSQVEGKQAVKIKDPTRLATQFTAPAMAGNYRFKLSVTDAVGNTYFDNVTYVFKARQKPATSPKLNDQQLFERFWQLVHANHAFVDQDHQRWEDLYLSYQARTNNAEFNPAWSAQVSKMLHSIEDQSLQVIPTAQVLAEPAEIALTHQQSLEKLASHCDVLSPQNQDKPEQFLTWCINKDNIGIVTVSAMPRQEIRSTLVRALQDLEGTHALLLDLTINTGESATSAMQLAQAFGHSSDEKTYSASYFSGQPVEQSTIEIDPLPSPYTKPVYVVTSEQTSGSAELLTYLLKQKSNVVHLGKPTYGQMSLLDSYTLPNGYTLRLAKRRFLDSKGQVIDTAPIVPSLELKEIKGVDWMTPTLKLAAEQ
ncbi:S41 family peptidase [Vibrio sonorensis]|uniref:S41 family peptidase n=1 Tax=Vibrio sonorensis TaxID=1004316 RepID=UPI0008D8FBCA|nr:S41 family peptidase [Vibrio sonorensis]